VKKIVSCGIALVFLLGAGTSHSQKVLRRVRQYVLIDMNASSGLAVGGEVDIYRKNELGFLNEVGRVRVVRYQAGKCAAEVVGESIDLKIQSGDFADIPRPAGMEETEPEDRTPAAEERANPEERPVRPAGDAFGEASGEASGGTVSVSDTDGTDEEAGTSSADAATAVYPVLRTRGNLCLIDIPEESGIPAGSVLTVWRRKSEGGDWDVGRVRILKFQAGKCAAEIIFESLGDRIARNDFIRGEIRSEAPGIADWVIDDRPRAPQTVLRKMGKVSLGTGIAAVAFGLMESHFAGQAENDYRRAATEADADRFHGRSVRLTRTAALATGAGAALIVSGVVEWLLGKPAAAADSDRPFSLTPMKGARTAGLSLNLHF
jgi:hypothetical protein